MMMGLAGAGLAGTLPPSFDVSGDEGVTVSAATLATLAVDGAGAQSIKTAISELLAGKPAGTQVRIQLGTFTEGSSRWQVAYLKSIVLLDAKGRPDGMERDITQQTVNGVKGYRLIPWKNGVKDGVEQSFVEDRLREELPWKNGIMEGVRRSLYPEGKVEVETQYMDGVANGYTRIYTKEGTLMREGMMKNGKRDGVMTEYWEGTKKPKRVAKYDEGRVKGVVKEYYLGGKLKREVSMKDESYHGEDKLYNETGKVAQTRYWFKGDIVTKDEFETKNK